MGRIANLSTGIPGRNGSITATIHNASSAKFKSAIYLQTFPWFIRPFMHTLKVYAKNDGGIINSQGSRRNFCDAQSNKSF